MTPTKGYTSGPIWSLEGGILGIPDQEFINSKISKSVFSQRAIETEKLSELVFVRGKKSGINSKIRIKVKQTNKMQDSLVPKVTTKAVPKNYLHLA